MFRPIEGAPPDVLAFDSVGVITHADYESFIFPTVEARLRDYGCIRIVSRYGPEFSHFSRRAAFTDAMAYNEYGKHVERFALVTDMPDLEHLIRLVVPIDPSKFRAFRLNALDEAISWARS